MDSLGLSHQATCFPCIANDIRVEGALHGELAPESWRLLALLSTLGPHKVYRESTPGFRDPHGT